MEATPDNSAEAQGLAIQQNAIKEGMIRMLPSKVEDPFIRPRTVGAEVLAEIMRSLPTE